MKRDKLKKLAKEAIDIQHASNNLCLCGLAQRFAAVMIELGPALDEAGEESSTEAKNSHSIVTLWLGEMASLNGFGVTRQETFFAAYIYCQELTEERR